MGFHQCSNCKNLPAMWETWICSLGWEYPLKKGMATHSSILAWSLFLVFYFTIRKTQFNSVAQSCLAPYDPMDIRAPGFLVLHQLLVPFQIRVHQVCNAIQPSHIPFCPLLLPLSIFPIIRVFSNESVLRIMWPKQFNFSFIISPSNEYSGLISF